MISFLPVLYRRAWVYTQLEGCCLFDAMPFSFFLSLYFTLFFIPDEYLFYLNIYEIEVVIPLPPVLQID